MNKYQELIQAIDHNSRLITTANGYTRDIAYLGKGYSIAKGDRSMFFILDDATNTPVNESFTLGRVSLQLSIYAYFKVNAQQGNATDEQEVILNDLIDWVIGAHGTGKKLDLSGTVDTFYISKVLRSTEFQENTNSRCGLELTVLFFDTIG